jgi:hypothetical protein
MTRKMAGIPKSKKPTRATKRGSLNRYCRSMEKIGVGIFRDFYGQKYAYDNGGLRRIA